MRRYGTALMIAGLVAIGAAGARAAEPYKTFKFLVQWDGATAPLQVSKVGPLIQRTEVLTQRSGNAAANTATRTPGLSGLDPIVFERGLTQDMAFANWAAQTQSLAGYRRNVVVTLLDEQSNPVIAFRLYNCWPSAYEALPALDAGAGAVAVERLTLQCDSWTRGTP